MLAPSIGIFSFLTGKSCVLDKIWRTFFVAFIILTKDVSIFINKRRITAY